jgi:hypothetical protein
MFGWLVSFLSLFLHNSAMRVVSAPQAHTSTGNTIHAMDSTTSTDLAEPSTDGSTQP